jgi:formylglycine-generating enzyme required for sulfatase activity/DNA-directed RNA polymerase subunit RPC12/RpoP
MKTCPTCQQTYSDDIESCPHDGARLATEFREERECPYCAERILRKARVCKHCGHDVDPLAGTGIAAQAASPALPERIVETPTTPPQASKPPAGGAPQFQTTSKSPGKMKFVAIAGVALILMVGGVWFFSQPPQEEINPHGGTEEHLNPHGPIKGDVSCSAKAGEAQGEVRVNSKDGLKYVWIPPGTFMMGCSPGDTECVKDEKPLHRVTITKGFWMGQTEVTVGAYKRFAGATGRQMPPEPDYDGRPLNSGWGDEAMPIVDVTWDDAQAYCHWAGGRLPTEAEWEYAARARSTAARYGDLDEIAWYADNSGSQRLDSARIYKEDEANYLKRLEENGIGMHEVGQKRANGFGLYDMLGNDTEWVNDWYDDEYYQNSPSQDPAGPTSGASRVLRGGVWSGFPSYVRVSKRDWYNPTVGLADFGFRCGGEVSSP